MAFPIGHAERQFARDELIRVTEAQNALMDLEELTEKELVAMHCKYEDLARQAREALRLAYADPNSPPA